jgi:RNA polymerase sigma-70 factor (ECF subfamily)
VDFDALYRSTYPRVLSYARAMAPPADAEDAVGETYATAWRRQSEIPADAELGWLIGVTRRVLANRRRGDRRLGALRTLLAGQRQPAGPDPAERVADSGLRAALETLAPVEREALVLVAWFDLSQADAAMALGISPAAFRMRLARARRRMRSELDPIPTLQEDPRWNLT